MVPRFFVAVFIESGRLSFITFKREFDSCSHTASEVIINKLYRFACLVVTNI